MKTKLLCLSLMLCFVLCACTPHEDLAISGTSFDPADYVNEGGFDRYENQLYGIIIEYPSGYKRVGNFELDGYISFEGDGNSIEIYVPDTENNDILTPEEYTNDILDIWYIGEESYNTKLGKTSGFKATRREGGKVRIDFAVKGVDAFYRFAYITDEEGFTEEDPIFQYVMSSIRIDDGIYNKLTRMAARYTVLFEYVTDMQYITDANYINHCLNGFELSGDASHKAEALTTAETIISEIEKITTHEREEDEGYEEEWEEILEHANAVISATKRVKENIDGGNIEEAQRITRTEFSYDLSDDTSKFIALLNAEIAEY